MCMHAGTEGLGTQCVPAFESSEEMARAATGDRRADSSVPLCSAQNDGAGDGGNPSTACGGPPPLDRGGLQEREAEIAAVQAAKEEMASDARRYKEELEAAQKALKLAAPEMAAFRARFEGAQEALDKAVDALWALPTDKVDGGVRAVRALLERVGKRLEEERYEAAMPE